MTADPATTLVSPAGEAIIAGLVLVAVAAIVWAVAILVTRNGAQRLGDVLSPYGLGQENKREAAGPSGTQDLVKMPIMRRLVNSVDSIATRQGVLQYIEGKLNQADLPIRPAEAFFLYLVAVVFAAAVAFLLGNGIWCLIAIALVGITPWMVLDVLANRRTDAFTAELPDLLQLLGTTLRSGFSVMQGLDTVSRQVSDPMGEELRRATASVRLGRPLTDALNDVVERVRSEDFAWVVTAIGIQREVGGNLAELLDIVAETMNARTRLRREVKTLTAEGRIGAVIISVMPVAIGLFVYSVNPGYITPMFQSTPGKLVIYGSIVLAIAGMLWIRKLVKIEV